MSGHKSHCHKKHTKLGTKCSCQHPSGHSNSGVLTPDSTDECRVFEYKRAKSKWDTSNFTPSQIKDRASVEQVESFLNEINGPLGEWSRKYGKVHEGSGKYLYIAIFLILLLPLLFVYTCWLNNKQDEAKAKLKEAKLEVVKILKKRRPEFTQLGLTWSIPEEFPQWIELWVNEGKKSAGDKAEQVEMVGYEQSGYPKSPANKVVPVSDGQFMFNEKTNGQGE